MDEADDLLGDFPVADTGTNEDSGTLLRRSERRNFGVGPQRYGHPASSDQRRPTVMETTPNLTENLTPSPSRTLTRFTPAAETTVRARSKASSGSSNRTSRTSSTVRMKQLELEAKIAEANVRSAKRDADAKIARA
ncbi:unnamed protein product, partial [Allacma fusca]